MEDLRTILSASDLEVLRETYHKDHALDASMGGFATAYPPLAEWSETAGRMFFHDKTLAPRQRELCLITLLTHRAPGVCLANHMYWGLMEGVSVDEICQAVGLAACYSGLPSYTEGIVCARRTFKLLHTVATSDSGEHRRPRAVLGALVRAFYDMAL
jgi:alkylhydroperoxidase/carboxymuconolactone decarboxylase family protein YurZ